MKHNLFLFLFTAFILASCNTSTDIVEENIEEEVTYSSFGSEITSDNSIDIVAMTDVFKNIEDGDTVPVKFKSEILEVCQKKGCWMKMDLEGEDKAFVRFTDYGFFVPFNAGEHEGIVEGRAFKSVVSVDELKHYAKDAGKSQEEIDAITEPEVTYSIQADGVLIKDIALETDFDLADGSEDVNNED